MTGFLVYSATTGEIIRYGYCETQLVATQATEPGEISIPNPEEAMPGTHYVEIGQPDVVTEKPPSPASIDVDSIAAGGSQVATITDIPPGSLLTVNGVAQGTINDGEVEFSAEAPGMYSLLLTQYHHLPVAFRIGVGMTEFAAAEEIELGVGAQAPLPAALEVEVAGVAVQKRTTRLTLATEAEVGVDAVTAVSQRLEPAEEVEIGQSPAYNLPEAVEIETGDDTRIDHAVRVDVAEEEEVALDAAA